MLNREKEWIKLYDELWEEFLQYKYVMEKWINIVNEEVGFGTEKES
jgi:hypothetical protein